MLFDFAGVFKGEGCLLHQVVDLGRQAFRRQRLPVSDAHFLQQGLHDFAAAFPGDQNGIGVLFRLKITDTEIQNVPRDLQICDTVCFIAVSVRQGGYNPRFH